MVDSSKNADDTPVPGRIAKWAAGKFMVFDGLDGCGKSTQAARFAASLAGAGLDVVTCRDPGGTEIGDRIRSVLLDYDLATMDVTCEALLFMASRAQLLAEVIGPAVAAGKTVVCDRFVTSTCAYQGAAGFDPARVIELATFVIGDRWPDVTVLLDLAVEEGFARIGRKPHHAGKRRTKSAGAAGGGMLFADAAPDAMEARSTDFHRRVRDLFLGVGDYYPRPVLTVDGRGDVSAVQGRVLEAIADVV
ncbi:MAG: dTMP kinase [Phycisphaerae bacterium]